MDERTPLEPACRGAGWVESPRLRCLGFDWSVRADEPALVRSVTDLYEGCIDPGPARHRFVLRTHPGPPSQRGVSLYRDGRVVLRDASPGLALAHLAWEVNRGVVDEAGTRLLLHAAAAERDGTVVLLPGPQGAGKSTLVASLVQAGLRYVTDETVAVDPASGTIEPYPKPIALDRAALAALPGLRPEAGWSHDRGPDQWLVAPGSIRADVFAHQAGTPRLVALPRYRPGRSTRARPLSRGQAAVALVEQAFNFETLGPGALERVAGVVRGCRCYRIELGDVGAAARLVIELLEAASER